MKTVPISFKADENIKKEFDRIAYDIGVSTSSLLNILVKRTVRENGIPFDVTANPRDFVNSSKIVNVISSLYLSQKLTEIKGFFVPKFIPKYFVLVRS